MTWVMLFCAWSAKSGGCVSPVSFASKPTCEFVLRHQIDLARQRDREWGWEGSMVISGRCIGVKNP